MAPLTRYSWRTVEESAITTTSRRTSLLLKLLLCFTVDKMPKPKSSKLVWIPCWTRYFQKRNPWKEIKATHVSSLSPDNSIRCVRIVHLFCLSRIPLNHVLYLLFPASSHLVQIAEKLRKKFRCINVEQMSLFMTSHTRALDFFIIRENMGYNNYCHLLQLASIRCPVIITLFVVV